MYTNQEIILRYYREGKSQRSISRELGLSRATVKKYIAHYVSVNKGCSSPLVTTNLSPPSYTVGTRSKVCLTLELQGVIDVLLEKNEENKSLGLSKQLLKKIDIYEHLKSQGFAIGYTTVCNYIRKKLKGEKTKEAFIRQSYTPGSSCEFDWGELKLYIGGELTRLQLAVFTASYSNYRYAILYHRQDTLAFMESHVDFHSHIGGVYQEMVYDNMRVAVARFIGKREKEPTKALLDLKGHYNFRHRFCNARKGNEKGHVERSVEYIRRKSFSFDTKFDSLEAAQAHLLKTISKLNDTKQQLTKKTSNELFAIEKSYLYKQPYPLKFSDLKELRVDKYATVSLSQNRYSVPENLVGEFVEVKIYSLKLEIYHSNELVASHSRSYAVHQWVIYIGHYLDTLKRKPGALAGSVALLNSDYLKELYQHYFLEKPKEFIELLTYCKAFQIANEHLEATVERLSKGSTGTLTLEKVKALLGNKTIDKKVLPLTENQTYDFAKNHLRELSNLMNQTI
jgi:transposase